MGGLLSLGFGVSFMRLIELGDFICVRLFRHQHNYLQKTGAEEQLPRRRFSVPGSVPGSRSGAASKPSVASMASAATDVSPVSSGATISFSNKTFCELLKIVFRM